MVREEGSDGSTLDLVCDPVGNCVAAANGLDERISYERDLLGSITAEVLSGGTTARFEYGVLSNLASAVNPDRKVECERDPLGNTII